MSDNHYFSEVPSVESDPQPVAVHLPDISLNLLSDRGVFSVGSVDRGTDFLLRSVPDPPAAGAILDLGCGWGVIAVVMALRSPTAAIWATDVNQRALDLTRSNAERVTAANVTAVTPAEIPADVRFAAIYSNPPVRVGKDALHAMLVRWIDRLEPGGAAYLVVHRHLGADSLAGWLIEQGYSAKRLRSRQGYRLLEVRRGAE